MDTARLARELPASKNFQGDLGRVVMRTLIYTLGVQVIHSMLHPNKPGAEDEGWGTWAAKELALSATSGIPVVRDLAAHWIEGGDYAVTPAAAAVRTLTQSATDAMHAMNGEETSGKWLKHAANTAGYAFGVPSGQLGDSAQFLWDVGQGYQDPHSFKDWWNGVLHGDMDAQ